MKVRLCVKLFDFFCGWILIRLTWNLSCFVPYVAFQENTILGQFFYKFGANQGYTLPKLVKFRQTFCNFILGLYCAKKFTQVLSYIFYNQVSKHVHKQIKKEDTGKKRHDVLFSEDQFCSLSVWDLLRLTPWVIWCKIFTTRMSLCLLRFGWDFSPRFVQQDWQKVFIHHCQRWKEGLFVCETVLFLSWVNTYPFDLKFVAFCPKFNGDSYVDFFGRIFQKFGANQGYQNTWNLALLSAILFWVHIALKNFTHVLSYVACTQVRRHVHKQIRKRRYGEGKSGRFVFGKQILFTLGLGFTTPYSLGILVWNFYQTVVIMSIDFWLRFEPQILPTRLTIKFLFITVSAERKVRFCMKLVDFFRGWILIRLIWNLLRFVPNSVEILTWNFRNKLFREYFSEFLFKPRLSSTKTSEIWPYFLQFYSWCVLCWKNSDKYFHMLFEPR